MRQPAKAHFLTFLVLFWGVLLFSLKIEAAPRYSSMPIPIATYHYLTVVNISSIQQTVILTIKGTGVTLKAGGFRSTITGWTVPGGPTASSGVSCATNICSLTATLSQGKSVRLGARVEKAAIPDFKPSGPAFSNETKVGLLAEVSISESSGRVVASALTWTDIDVNPTNFIDVATVYSLNGGMPF